MAWRIKMLPVTLELFSRNDIWTEADKNVSHFDFLSSDDSVYIKCAVKFIEDGFDGQVDYTDLNDEVLSDFEKLRPLLKSSFNYCKNSWKPTLYNEASLRYFSLEYLIRKSFRSAPAKEAILFADLKKRMMVFISENLDESEISKQIEGANFSSIEHLLSEGGASRVSQAFISDYYFLVINTKVCLEGRFIIITWRNAKMKV